jgi:arginase
MPATKKSMFGIDDCHFPKKNSRAFKKTKNKTIKRKSRPYKYETVILFPHSLGQSNLGTEKAPHYLNKFINKKTHRIKKIKNTGNLFKNINTLYQANQAASGKIINIGGDHSMSIATIADTLNKYPNAKVIYFDAHADLNTYKSSKSKHYHGMPLSFITGLDQDSRFSFINHKLPFENLLYIGSRCWDPYEVNEAYKRNIKFITPDEINNNFSEALNKILNFVGDAPVHVSFDVDSLDPKYIPSTGTPVKNGIELSKAKLILDKLNSGNMVNMDITELNMRLGKKTDGLKSGKNTAKLFHHFLK